MSTPLHIPDSQLPRVKEAMQSAYDELKKRMDDLQRELDEMTPLLKELGIIRQEPQPLLKPVETWSVEDFFKPQVITIIPKNGYNPAWKWLRKIEYVIGKVKKPLTSIEVVEEIAKLEPNESKIRLMNSVPATLSTAYRDKKLQRKQNDKGEYVYDLIEDLPY